MNLRNILSALTIFGLSELTKGFSTPGTTTFNPIQRGNIGKQPLTLNAVDSSNLGNKNHDQKGNHRNCTDNTQRIGVKHFGLTLEQVKLTPNFGQHTLWMP